MRWKPIAMLAALPLALHGQGVISTIAGSTWTFPADGRPATVAPLGRITDLALGPQGDLYVADPDNFMVMKVAPNGILSIAAGNGISNFSGDFGPAVNASLRGIGAIAVDSKGNLYIVDAFRVRKVTTDGTISTVAGNGDYAISADGGRATDSSLSSIGGLAVDPAGNLYLGEWGIATGDQPAAGTRIRVVSPAGIIGTVAGTGTSGQEGDGGPALKASFYKPGPMALDSAGNIFFVDGGDQNRVRVFKPGGNIATAAQGINAGGIAVDPSGTLYVADRRGGQIKRLRGDGVVIPIAGTGDLGYSGDGGAAVAAVFANPAGVAVDASGRIYISDTNNERLRVVDARGVITTIGGNGGFKFAGDGSAASGAFLNQPTDVVVDAAGTIYIADTLNNRIRKISAGIITTFAGTGFMGTSGDGGPATNAPLCYPTGVALDSKGNLYIAERGRVRKVSPGGVISTLASSDGSCGGAPAPIQVNSPGVLAVDSRDRVYVGDAFKVLRLDPAGATVLAGNGGLSAVPPPDGTPAAQATLEYVSGLALGPDGVVYFGQQYSLSRIRTINPDGTLGTVAGLGSPGVLGDGGPALQSEIGPASLRFDASGALLVADQSDHRIRRINGGIINSVAGGGFGPGNGDGGPALSAVLTSPNGVAGGADGSLYIADSGGDRIRFVPAAPAAFSVSSERLDFTALSGGAAPPDQTIQIASPVAGLAYTAVVSNGRWLTVRPSSGVLPATLLLTANPAAENAGIEEAQVTITVPLTNQLHIVNVSFNVTPAAAPRLTADTDGLSYPAVQGSAPALRAFHVLNNSATALNFTASANTSNGGPWLSLTATGGTVSAGSPQNIGVRLIPGTLAPGTYSGLITVSTTDLSQLIFLPVSLTITSSAQAMVLSQSGLAFQAVEGATTLAPQSFSVLNSGSGIMNWTVAAPVALSGGSWLSASPSSGASGPGGLSASPVQVKVDPTGLTQGQYYGQIDVAAPGAANSPQRISVVTTIVSKGNRLRPDVKPAGLIFVSSPDLAGVSQVLTLTNYGATPITFQSSQSSPEFDYRPQSGTITADQPLRVVVTAKSGLPVGLRHSALTLAFSDGSSALVDILIVVPPASAAARSASPHATGCTPSALGLVFTLLGQAFTSVASVPTPLGVRVVDDCGTFLTSGAVVASFSNADRLLPMISTSDGYWDGTWVPSPGSTGVTIRVDGQNLDRTLSGFIQIAGGVDPHSTTPSVARGRIVNAASPALLSPIAPGTLITIYGENLAAFSAVPDPGTVSTQLAGALVAMKGTALQLLYASATQINAIVPLDLQPNTSYQLFVQQRNKVAVPVEVLVSSTQPAIFTTTGNGVGQGAIVTLSGAIADSANPAHPKDTIVIFAAGLGAVTPAVPFGTPSPSNPPVGTLADVHVNIGGKDAEVDFAGLAPTFFGLYQINAVVPADVSPGDTVPVTISAAGQTSPSVTIAVR